MRIATWNVNSIAARLPAVSAWLAEHQPDVLCLQEIKCVAERFPAAAFAELGYQAVVFGQPTYNGVAILAREATVEVERGFPGEDGGPARLIAATVGPIRVVNVYVPNGAPLGSDRYTGKLDWLGRLRQYLEARHAPAELLALCGDFNVAPEPRDVYDPEGLASQVLFTPPERAALAPVAVWGLVDTFRLHQDEAGHYSWWDYRQAAFRRNLGLRIDHIWATPPLAAACTAAWIDCVPRAGERPSDHVPVVADFAL
ncbi:MAG TPA: exodeoxyribonuclease III [Chloroflexota bacterium]|nr:exodeoxyribonuclease III [Chloroflexota bacterium]